MAAYLGQEFSDASKLNKLKKSHQLLNRVIEGKNAERVPNMVTMVNWIFEYTGKKLQQAIWNHEIIAQAYDTFLKEFPFDLVFSGYYQDARLHHILGNERNNLFDQNMTTLQTIDVELLLEDEYKELIEDPYLCILNKVLPRKFKRLSMPNTPQYANALAEGAARFVMSFEDIQNLNNKILQNGSYHLSLALDQFMHPLEYLVDWRGLKGFSIDIRRRPEVVKEAVNAIMPLVMSTAMPSAVNPNVELMKSVSIAGHFMGMKAFEDIFWPTYRQQIETFINFGKKVFIWLEGDWIRFYDHLSELPPNSVALYMETADFKLAKNKFKNRITVAGGMPVTMLGNESKEKCINYTKELIDALAPGGGYIFSFDKLMNTKNDCDPENLRAVLDTVLTYGSYK